MIKFEIDEKSLYFGIKNDYSRGQTATVSTPINQSKDPGKWRNDIIALYNSQLELKYIPLQLLEQCQRKTTSNANSLIKYFYEFKNLYLDGLPIHTNYSFGIYIKVETDSHILNKNGKRVLNTHYGREKIHYPTTLNHQSDGFCINNKAVLEQILIQNGEFAYVVRGFEINVKEKSLNFLTTIIGPKNILLSSVFKKKKGVGKKLITKSLEQNITPIIQTHNDEEISPKLMQQSLSQKNQSMIENGRLGEEIAYQYLMNMIKEHPQTMGDLFHTSKSYVFSPYDLEYTENGTKKYIEVKATSSEKKVFNMSSGEIKFMERYKDSYKLLLITKVKDKFPIIHELTPEEIFKFKKEYPSTRFYE